MIPIDFEFLVRGGRLNGMAGVLGGLLKLMAVMKKELNTIVNLGALIGCLIGILNIFL